MRIGLIRHFEVLHPLPKEWVSAGQLEAWQQNYDQAEIRKAAFHTADVDWKQCLSSDLPRARSTARAVFAGDIQETELLRELTFSAFKTGNLRLPVSVWKVLVRLAWMTGHASQRTSRDEFLSRVQKMSDLLCTFREDTLVVAHAGMMLYLSRELCRRGFVGPRLRIADHAVTYVYFKP